MSAPSTRARLGIAAAALLAAGAGAAFYFRRGPSEFDPSLAARVVQSYAALLHAAYSDAAARAEDLERAIGAFAAAPSAEGLEACKAAWIAGRGPYLQTEVARFYEGPVDGGSDAPELFLNAWPLDESYIDYVAGLPQAGLINDPAGFPRIDAESLRAANEKGGETHISTGWHALEFLLWGQDLEIGAGGGRRSFRDYVDGGGTASHEARRRDYLRACAAMLVRDLRFLRDQWAPGNPHNYRAWFVGLEPRGALIKIMSGAGTLAFGELRGERLLVPYNTKDREDEHSCFSDTTHLDHVGDAIGLRNVWEGTYASSDGKHDHRGPGLADLARAVDPALARETEEKLAQAIEALRSPDLQPFEAAIRGTDDQAGRRAVKAAMARLSEFTTAFFTLASRMDLSITTNLVK